MNHRQPVRIAQAARARIALAAFASIAAAIPIPITAHAQAHAQVQARAADGPILRLESQTSSEVAYDVAVATFFVERDGAQPAQLQAAVNAILKAALADLKADSALQVRSGSYSTQPRYSRDGRIENWRVRAELVAESGEIGAISQATSTLSGRMNVGSIGFRLSDALRARTEQSLTGEAAVRFYEKARSAAKALGYADVELIEANFNTGMPSHPPIPLARAMAGAEAVPVEPGRTQVTVTFSGALRLRR